MPKVAGTIYRKGIQRCLDVPKSVFTTSSAEPRPPVVVTIGGQMFESTLLPRDARNFQLVIPMAILRKLGRDAGDVLKIGLRHDKKREAPAVPSELLAALRLQPLARKVFEAQTVAMKRQIARFIDSGRAESTRLARAETLVLRLLSWKSRG
jgi:bifunctional DNA-binding transcriptional regulator/antitoxin component of YhaV-PrlF toxin-antitoxin module